LFSESSIQSRSQAHKVHLGKARKVNVTEIEALRDKCNELQDLNCEAVDSVISFFENGNNIASELVVQELSRSKLFSQGYDT
jgi:hypothetical protein